MNVTNYTTSTTTRSSSSSFIIILNPKMTCLLGNFQLKIVRDLPISNRRINATKKIFPISLTIPTIGREIFQKKIVH